MSEENEPVELPEDPKEPSNKPNPWLALLTGGVFGFVVPVMVFDQAFKSRPGWFLGVICVILGLAAGAIAAFGMEREQD